MKTLVLTLVAQRDATTLSDDIIATAQECMHSTHSPSVLSPGEAADIICPADAAERLPLLQAALGDKPVDAVLTHPAARRKHLLVSDMDSTIVAGETLDDLATHAGIGDKIAAITARSMNGELDFATALRERVALLKGFPASLLEKAWQDVRLNDGAKALVQTMRAHGAYTALVSGGFTFFTERVAALCNFQEHHANTLLSDNGFLTGETGQPVLGPDTKLHLLNTLSQRHHLAPEQALAIGDGANDLPMLQAAGLGLAFFAKPVVREKITAQINHTSLRTALFAQGYPASVFPGP
ncbi:phosphoserine phosphatase SerB [Acetobacter thailandicus]|uniref:Phosphoserine phosphatase n=1 Tax=Acetobacter thailandicus TaxID=1502842 RepID=A0ABT3QBJ1_9PROT|nr:phosphoserine phosphatase SerB [Acetobacter thailandicus]MBS0959176.1 phosphoserine phosphatase SerB [Acetobacter thailandicus]MBS0980796.1 phosphoserine phosphatase SerB [Acetobacter thailandicus]MBS0984936.1 phosphoserine phosphatase SerB [Acetobacter thailandicus]MCX2562641.1 phosphoserine phosphatase SerB [Acetobacter thailandicus]NHN94707.1 phosphoserine phosphatase SerB [Acetobacter thailandicus]